MLRRMRLCVSIHDAVRSGGSWTAAWMPYGGTLQVHFLAVAERVAAFRATCASRMEMVVVASLQNLAADIAITVGALNSKLLLIIFFAVRHAVFSHVFAMEHSVAAVTLEAPDVPLTIERDQCLTFSQLVSTTGAGTRIGVSVTFGTGAITNRRGGLTNWDANTSMTQSLTLNERDFRSLSQ